MGAFRAAADSNDRLYRTRAELALVDLEMENGTLERRRRRGPAGAAALRVARR